MTRVTLDLGSETEARLSQLAAERGLSLSETVNAAVLQFLDLYPQAGGMVYRPLGEPNAESIAAMDELDPNRKQNPLTIDDFKAWIRSLMNLRMKRVHESKCGRLNLPEI